MKQKMQIIGAGAFVGIAAVLLVYFGNPANMGFCIACFVRDITGALGMHRAGVVQYIRPEIIGIILGSLLISIIYREFKPVGGSSPIIRFVLGMLMMSGALIFLGCPLRMILRIAGGDWNALVALPGFVVGIWLGTIFLKKGYSLGRSSKQFMLNGLISPVFALSLFVLLIAAPSYIYFSTSGPGSMRAPIYLTLIIGLTVGIFAQRSRLCTMGGIRDIILFKDFHLGLGILAILVFAFAGNLLTGKFHPGFAEQPVAHTDGIFNFLGMGVVGLAAVFAGGCPLRQLVLSGEGQSDATITVFGMIAGAAIMHNFGLAAGPAGLNISAKWSVLIMFILLTCIGFGGVLSGKKQH